MFLSGSEYGTQKGVTSGAFGSRGGQLVVTGPDPMMESVEEGEPLAVSLAGAVEVTIVVAVEQSDMEQRAADSTSRAFCDVLLWALQPEIKERERTASRTGLHPAERAIVGFRRRVSR